MKTWKSKNLKALAKVLANLKNENEVANFLRDLCTLEELSALSSRWEAAKLLHEKVPYREVAARTGLSTATVTRIAYWLKHGEGGYKKALQLESEE